MTFTEMIERFQCPGCVCGSDATCDAFTWDESEKRCTGHVLGTMLGLGNSIALGLPRGFHKPGFNFADNKATRQRNTIDVRLWPDGTYPKWNRFNVAVWAMEQDGCLFVRTFAARVNMSWVDVIEGGTLTLVPAAINVAEFWDQID